MLFWIIGIIVFIIILFGLIGWWMSAVYSELRGIRRELGNNAIEHRDLIDRDHWVDGSTRGIPTYYGWAHFALATALSAEEGNEEEIDRNVAQVDAWMSLADR